MPKKIAVFHSVLDNIASFGRLSALKVPDPVPRLPILAVLGNMVFALSLCSPAFGQATGNTTIQPDCLIPFTFTAAGSFPATPVTGGAGDNRTKGCAAWTLMYQNTGMTSVSVTLQSGSSVSTTVSWGSFAGTISSGFVNPIVSDTGGSLQATNGTADISWVRVNVAATGTGTLTGVLYGFRNTSTAVNNSANCPSGAANTVQKTNGVKCVASSITDNGTLISTTEPAWSPNWSSGQTLVTAAGMTTTLAINSSRIQQLRGVLSQTFVLPDATTLLLGWTFEFNNNSSGSLVIQTNGGAAFITLPPGGYARISASSISTAAGTWDSHFLGPTLQSYTLSTLATVQNGTQYYCSDCTVTSSVDNTCAGSGAGAVAQRVNGAWKCAL